MEKKFTKVSVNILAVALFFQASNVFSKIVEEGALVGIEDKNIITLLRQHPDLTLDHPTNNSIEVYGPKGTVSFLKTLTKEVQRIEHNNKNSDDYPTSQQIEEKLIELTKKHPEILTMFSLGKTHQGKDIWAIKISDNPDVDELEPETKYIANMHGDEIVGRELMVLLIEELANGYKNQDEQIVNLVNSLEIFIVPSMNPDGADKVRRGNHDWVDLNRDFPDFTTRDNQNDLEGREPETKAIMKFQRERNFSLSANFHGGAEVVNYPWDTTGDEHPLHEHVLQLSLDYAKLVPGMRDNYRFPNGVVNGYDWYEVNGGMQDWSYHWHEDLQITIELSNQKYPNYSAIEKYWKDNRDSLLNFLESAITGIGFENKKGGSLFIKIYQNDELIFSTTSIKKQFFKAFPKASTR